jgi:hypothetical protein
MKMQYLAKRVRPDLLTTTGFLNSRILKPDVEDNEKLERALRYLRLGGKQDILATPEITAFVDASYGVHVDFKSRTRQVITVDGGPVHVQRLNSKSSTEAELIGLSDSLSQVLWTRDILKEQG